MRARKLSTLALAVAALAGCAGPPGPAPQAAIVLPAGIAERVDNMRGCWIAREGTGATFLRLLPPAYEAPVIEGSLDLYSTTEVEHTARLSFTRDGASASLQHRENAAETFVHAAPDWAPRSRNWLTYRSTTEPTLYMLIEAPGETLRIMTTLGPGAGQPMAMSPLYEANRDGCD